MATSENKHDAIAKFYNEVYFRDAVESAQPSRHLQRLADRLGVRAGSNVLDIACGTGSWLSVLAERGATPSGIDISERAIEVCRARMPDGVFHIGPAESLPFSDGQFDLVTCLGSLEHFLDQPAALREMVRVLKPDAQAIILVPNSGFLTYRLGLYSGTQQQAVRETLRSLDEWQAMFSDAGFDVVAKWKDLHVLDMQWILRRPWYAAPFRLMQALALTVWPLSWQYQVYHRCTVRTTRISGGS